MKKHVRRHAVVSIALAALICGLPGAARTQAGQGSQGNQGNQDEDGRGGPGESQRIHTALVESATLGRMTSRGGGIHRRDGEDQMKRRAIGIGARALGLAVTPSSHAGFGHGLGLGQGNEDNEGGNR
jgi:hypothetical protein